MNVIGFNNTKKKLTIIFTLIVFFIAVLLEGVFFSFKYFNYINDEKNNFNEVTNNVTERFTLLKEFVVYYDIGNRLFKLSNSNSINLIEKGEQKYVNLLIIEKEKRELVFSNVIDDLKLSFVEYILEDISYGKIVQHNGYFVRKIELIDNNTSYDVLFIKNLDYNFLDYLKDLLGFIWIMFLFSVLFFYIGYRFVSKNLEPVEKSLSDMQDFIHNAGHELKTPISIIHSNLQLIKELKKYDKTLITEGLHEINKLNNLIESLVELSSISSNQMAEKIDINGEIESIIKDFKTEYEKKEIKINYIVNSKKDILSNRQYFYILFSNILGNAIKYSNKGGQIDINLYSDKIIIKDNGIGISKEDQEKIFDRFFMCGKCRNVNGYGIGLSLVKKIAEIYKWKITVKSEEGKGSEFTVCFNRDLYKIPL